MAKEKDIIIRRHDGLYGMAVPSGKGGGIGWVNKALSTHFTSKVKAKRLFPELKYHNVTFIDLNAKGKRNGKGKKVKKASS